MDRECYLKSRLLIISHIVGLRLLCNGGGVYGDGPLCDFVETFTSPFFDEFSFLKRCPIPAGELF
jgi:hypothetical protein